MTELPKEDKALISDMNERLKRLEDIIADRMSPCIAEEIIQPIDTTEGEVEYRKMLTESMMNITKGKIYKCYYQKGEDAYTIINDIGNMDKDWNVVCFEDKTYTHAEFLAQEQGKEPNPNVIKFYDKYFKKAKTIAPIETEQRCKPKLLEVYYYINEQFKVSGTNFTHSEIDNPRILAGNCFKTEQEAQKVAEAIKQYLTTNKF